MLEPYRSSDPESLIGINASVLQRHRAPICRGRAPSCSITNSRHYKFNTRFPPCQTSTNLQDFSPKPLLYIQAEEVGTFLCATHEYFSIFGKITPTPWRALKSTRHFSKFGDPRPSEKMALFRNFGSEILVHGPRNFRKKREKQKNSFKSNNNMVGTFQGTPNQQKNCKKYQWYFSIFSKMIHPPPGQVLFSWVPNFCR